MENQNFKDANIPHCTVPGNFQHFPNSQHSIWPSLPYTMSNPMKETDENGSNPVIGT